MGVIKSVNCFSELEKKRAIFIGDKFLETDNQYFALHVTLSGQNTSSTHIINWMMCLLNQ